MHEAVSATAPSLGNITTSAEWYRQAENFRTRLLRVAREAEVADALLGSIEDDIDGQITAGEFLRITGTRAALARIKSLAAVNPLPASASGMSDSTAPDEASRADALNLSSDLETALIDAAEEAEVAAVLLSSLEQVTAGNVDSALFLRLVGALDAVRRMQALAEKR